MRKLRQALHDTATWPRSILHHGTKDITASSVHKIQVFGCIPLHMIPHNQVAILRFRVLVLQHETNKKQRNPHYTASLMSGDA